MSDISVADILAASTEIEETQAQDATKLGQVGKLAKEQTKLECEIQQLQDLLEQRTKSLRDISERELPELMQSLCLRKVTLDDGSELEVKPFYAAHISAARSNEAFAWLKANEYASLCKTFVEISFTGVEPHDLEDTLKELGYTYTKKQSVHPQTLKAFVKERIESGKPLPLETFGVHTGNKTTIRPKKEVRT